MCAISGIIGLPSDERICQAMLRSMDRRGPDGRGVYRWEECTLLHTRLAIIDPEGGRQPMCLDYGAERYCIVYNGELYNTDPVRDELQKLGHHFLTYSDTEVILHAYVQWKEKCVERFNGIFAFAVWEQNSKKLFLARDRIGVKPLFFCLHEGGLIFASEIKTILAYPSVKPMLDEQGAAELILLGPGRTPGNGIFHGISELEPGYRGYYQYGRLHTECYWKLKDREHRETFQETVECVRYLVTDAVKTQMVSDVPIGTFLSGGLDSSLITAICSEEMETKGEQLHTFSVDYRDNDLYFQSSKFQPNSDSAYIRLMERSVNSRHNWTVLEPDELFHALKNAVIARDLPGMADVDASLLLFCGKIREHVKVALSGECADEIFGGYPWYRDPEIRAVDGFPWAQNGNFRGSLLLDSVTKRIDSRDYIHDRYEATCLQSDILPGTKPEERRMKEMVNLNFRWFMQTLLDRKDRMSMYSGLEVRVPFCDYRIAEYLYGVPWEFKDHNGEEKGLLRKAMEGILPNAVLHRKKSPYPKTFDPRYTELVNEQMRSLLEDGNSPMFYLLNKKKVEDLLFSDQPWPWYGQLMRGPQTIAYLLQLDFWLRYYDVQFLF